MANIGDTVRFLNAVGGGTITRIDGRTAYVTDADGFDTPVLLSECVVVPSASEGPKIPEQAKAPKAVTPANQAKKANPATKAAINSNAVCLLFEPQDIRRLSQTAFDLYLVNDTPLSLHYAVSTRDRLDSEWSLLAHGLCEPGMQDLLSEVFHTELNRFENIAVQLISFDPERPFGLQPPVAFRTRFDVTRLAKLHCFTSTPYSTAPVLTINVLTPEPDLTPLAKTQEPVMPAPKANPANPAKKAQKPSEKVIDLHAHELLDTTAGLQPADILAYQLDVFDREMTETARTPGASIIFIHGKGNGVLRKAILDRLRRRWPRCEAQDASFREYGFGATRIIIHR